MYDSCSGRSQSKPAKKSFLAWFSLNVVVPSSIHAYRRSLLARIMGTHMCASSCAVTA
jgi:hypothetical protein